MGSSLSTTTKRPNEKGLRAGTKQIIVSSATLDESARQHRIAYSAQRRMFDNSIITSMTIVQDEIAFRFLDLPVELRYAIYEYHLLHCDNLRLVNNRFIVPNSNLSLVSQAIHAEFEIIRMKPALLAGRTVICKVNDFDFKPLMANLNKLAKSKEVLNALQHRQMPKLLVKLSISKQWSESSCLDCLPKWYKWMTANSHIDVEYGIGAVEDVERTYGFLQPLIWAKPNKPSRDLVRMFACFIAGHSYLERRVKSPDSLKAMQDDEAEVLRYCVEGFGIFA